MQLVYLFKANVFAFRQTDFLNYYYNYYYFI